MTDEIPVVVIGGYNRIAFDRRPPASRMSRKAQGTYGERIRYETRATRPVFATAPPPPRPRPGVVSTQPFHQRVRIEWRGFLGV